MMMKKKEPSFTMPSFGGISFSSQNQRQSKTSIACSIQDVGSKLWGRTVVSLCSKKDLGNLWSIVVELGADPSQPSCDFVRCWLHRVPILGQDYLTINCQLSVNYASMQAWNYQKKTFGMSPNQFDLCVHVPTQKATDSSLLGTCKFRFDIEVIDEFVWYPQRIQQQNCLVQLYGNAQSESETPDIEFLVDEKRYRAHKCILEHQAAFLHNISYHSTIEHPFEIDNTRPEIFKMLLEFSYTVNTEPILENLAVAKELLIAADFFQCVPLKLYAESVIVEKFLSTKNTAALLLFADAYSCALLKEKTIREFVFHPQAVKESEAWSTLESNRLFKELLYYAQLELDWNGRESFDIMSVAGLRDELEVANLPLDGSREVLVKSLKEHRQTQLLQQTE